MMNDQDISERNAYLIALIRELDLGIHVIHLPHKPKLLSADYKWWFHGYVKNFQLILKPLEFTDEVFFETKLRPIEKMDVQAIRDKFLDWMVNCNHKRIYTISYVKNNAGLFVTGFNHHNKVSKTNPYPVFARFDPLIYFDKSQAQAVVDTFTEYQLQINE